MSLIYVLVPMPELFWGVNRVFKYIGFYALGVTLAGQIKTGQVAERKITSGGIAIILLVLNFILAYYGLTRGAYVVCNRRVWSGRRRSDGNANQPKLYLAIPRTDFLDNSLHSWPCISSCGKNCIHSFAHEYRYRERKSSISVNCCGHNTDYLQCGL